VVEFERSVNERGHLSSVNVDERCTARLREAVVLRRAWHAAIRWAGRTEGIEEVGVDNQTALVEDVAVGCARCTRPLRVIIHGFLGAWRERVAGFHVDRGGGAGERECGEVK